MELLNVTECYFVTGTDTEIGKTIACVALLKAARQRGLITVGYKPVATGSETTSTGLRNSDALALQRHSSLPMLSYASINPYTFAESTSPHIVSKCEGKKIEFARLTQGLKELASKADFVLIEGAGGWFTPLTSTKTFADWVIQEHLPVILVVGIKLGCINHAMLTVQAITQAGLYLAGWIANNLFLPSKRHMEYLSTLNLRINATFLGEIPWLPTDLEKIDTGQYIDFSLLSYS